MFTNVTKWLAGRMAGIEIERAGRRTVMCIDKTRREEAWFSLNALRQWIFAAHSIDLVVDVGANCGQYAVGLRSFYKGDIWSFEPVSSAYDRLSQLASRDPKWRVFKCALGSNESRQVIHIASKTTFSSLKTTNRFCAAFFGQESMTVGEEIVSIRRLDNVMNESGCDIEKRRIFVKMDTQGYDLEVFKGLGDRCRLICAIQSEIAVIPIYDDMPHWTTAIETYEKNGFHLVGLFPVSRDAGRVIEYDCLMVKKTA